MSLDKILKPRTAPDVLVGTLLGSHRHQCLLLASLSVLQVVVDHLCTFKKKQLRSSLSGNNAKFGSYSVVCQGGFKDNIGARAMDTFTSAAL